MSTPRWSMAARKPAKKAVARGRAAGKAGSKKASPKARAPVKKAPRAAPARRVERPAKAAKAAPAGKPAKPAKPVTQQTPAKPAKPARQPGSAKPAQAARAARAPAPAKAPREAAAPRAPVERTRVVIAMDVYEPNKDRIKAPFREHELKWTFLGEGKGLYKRADNGVHCFTQFKDDGVHYSIWGNDKARVEKILGAWRAFLGEEGWRKATTSGEQAVAAERQETQSEAMRLWKLAEPQPRAGEPEFFLKKRIAEWQAKKPA